MEVVCDVLGHYIQSSDPSQGMTAVGEIAGSEAPLGVAVVEREDWPKRNLWI